jgi:Zn-dependent metalloprotease
MKRNLSFGLAAGALLFSLAAIAQDAEKGLPGMYPASIDFKNNPKTFTKGSVIIADAFGKTATANDAVLIRSDKDELGIYHYRYQQTYMGIPVEHATYVMHVNNGSVISENGKWIKDFPQELKASPALTKEFALSAATGEIGAQSYKWQVPAEEALKESRIIRLLRFIRKQNWCFSAVKKK